MAVSLPLLEIVPVFMFLFLIFVFLGFYGARFRRGNLDQLWDWALAGRKLGPWLAFFLLGADWYTAYSILSVPAAIFALGAFGFFGVTYQAMVFTFAMVFIPRLWTLCRNKGYITASDFVRDKFNSRALSLLISVVGVIAILPYIALQIVGLQAVIASMLVGTVNATQVQEIALVVAFVILAGFTFTSGLRGATLGSVFKDVIVWITLLAMVVVALTHTGGFTNVFSGADPKFLTLSPPLAIAFSTSMLGTVFSAYLWPHNINSALGAENERKLRIGIGLAVLYAIPLALADLLGIAVYKMPAAMNFLSNFPPASRGIFVIPAIALSYLPGWFGGVALVGIFVGGLVPAAVMAISQGNLIARNVVKEFKPNLTEKGEASIAKWASAFFKFLALALVFVVPATYSIQFFLVGAMLIIQLLPTITLSLYTSWFKKEALGTGLVVSIIAGVYLTMAANKFGPITTTLYPTPLGSMYIGIIVLGINLLLAVALSAVIPKRSTTG